MTEKMISIARRLDESGHHDIADRIERMMKTAASTQWWNTHNPSTGGYSGRMLGKDANTGGDWYVDARGNYWYAERPGDWKQYVKKEGQWQEAMGADKYQDKGTFLGKDSISDGQWYRDAGGNYWYQDPNSGEWLQQKSVNGEWQTVTQDDPLAWKPYAGKVLGQDSGMGGVWYQDEQGRYWFQASPGDIWEEYINGENGWTPSGAKIDPNVINSQNNQNPAQSNGQIPVQQQGQLPAQQGQMNISQTMTPGGRRILIGPEGAYLDNGTPVYSENGIWYYLGDQTPVDGMGNPQQMR